MSDTTSTSKNLKPYIIQEWVNGENTNTPISAERLTHMEVGIDDLSKTLLDGRLPAYTVTSQTAPAPSTPCILVVIDGTGVYQGTWRDDGKTRIQIGWGPNGDNGMDALTPSRPGHEHDWATITRHGAVVDMTGYYTPEKGEKSSDVNYPIYLSWIKLGDSIRPPHVIYSTDVTLEGGGSFNPTGSSAVPRMQISGSTGSSMPALYGVTPTTEHIYFHVVWMTDAAPLPDTALKSAAPEAAPETQSTAPAAPAATSQQTPTVQAPAEQASAPQATQAQEQVPAAQPDASQAPAQQEQAAVQAPATQAVQEQAPARTAPAHAAPGQTPAVQAPAVQNAPAPAASTARHAKPGLEE